MKTVKALFLWIAAAILAVAPTDLDSCGPFLAQAVFTPRLGPPDPHAGFTQGKLGVLRPAFRTAYLIVAYRYLTGKDLTPAESDALFPKPATQTTGTVAQSPNSRSIWVATRQNIVKAPPEGRLDDYKSVSANNTFYYFQNCSSDAFLKAAETLTSRAATWGDSSLFTLDWIAAQDRVFFNCSSDKPVTPGQPPAGAPPLLQADRAYQIAAAAFYAGNYPQARAAFLRIASDKSSPWSRYGAYLAARTYLRQGTIENDPQSLNRAAMQLASLRNDPAAAKLLPFVETRLHPEQRLDQLAAALTQPRLTSAAAQQMTDFLYVYWNNDKSAPRVLSPQNDLLNWLGIWKARTGAADPVAHWRDHGGLPWLIAALYHVPPQDASVPELLKAALAVASDSPAYPSVAFYAAALHSARGSKDEARRWADRLLASSLEPGDRNLVLRQRLSLARDWNEFIRFSPRSPKFFDYDEGGLEAEESTTVPNDKPAFDADAANAWNSQIPLSLWIDAVRKTSLPKNLRIDLARTGWTRAVVLDLPAEAKILAQLWTELDPTEARAAPAYRSAAGPAAAHFAEILTLLRTPGLTLLVPAGFGRESKLHELDHLRTNWWCVPPPSNPNAEPAPAPPIAPADRMEGQKQSAQISSSAPSGANYVTAEAIRWANERSADPDIPEALGRAVQATHYNPCGDSRTGLLSQQAFDLLKQRYPETTWAKETKYWYK